MKCLLLLMVLLVSPMGAFAEHHQGPEQVIFETTIGTITFLHVEHQAKISDCTECHHKGVDKGKCRNCHTLEGKDDIPKAYHAFHVQCKGCHRNSSGPTHCKGCHVKN